MKKILFLMIAMLTFGISYMAADEAVAAAQDTNAVVAEAQVVVPDTAVAEQGTITSDDESSIGVADLSTFAGVITLVSLIGTQLCKFVPKIGENKLYKILTSVGIGIIATFIAWAVGIAKFLDGTAWWLVLIYGIVIGLAGSGMFDFLKALFAKKTEPAK